MNINHQSIERIEHLKPLLRFMSDFCDVLIADDAKDIMVFSTPSHPSPIHHNQFGFLIKMLSEMGITFVEVGKKMLEREDRQNFELRQILSLVQQTAAERKETMFQERILQEKRLILLKQYFEAARMEARPQNQIIFGGNLNDIRVNRPKPLPDHIEAPRVPKARLQT